MALQPANEMSPPLYSASSNKDLSSGNLRERELIPFFLEDDSRNVNLVTRANSSVPSNSIKSTGLGGISLISHDNIELHDSVDEFQDCVSEDDDDFDVDIGFTLDCLMGPEVPKSEPLPPEKNLGNSMSDSLSFQNNIAIHNPLITNSKGSSSLMSPPSFTLLPTSLPPKPSPQVCTPSPQLCTPGMLLRKNSVQSSLKKPIQILKKATPIVQPIVSKIESKNIDTPKNTSKVDADGSSPISGSKYAWASFQNAPEARFVPMPSWVSHLPTPTRGTSTNSSNPNPKTPKEDVSGKEKKRGRNRKKKDNQQSDYESGKQQSKQRQKKQKDKYKDKKNDKKLRQNKHKLEIDKQKSKNTVKIEQQNVPKKTITILGRVSSKQNNQESLNNMSSNLMGMLGINSSKDSHKIRHAQQGSGSNNASDGLKSLLGIGR